MREIRIKTVDEGMDFERLRQGDIVHVDHLASRGSGFYVFHQNGTEKELVSQRMKTDVILAFPVPEGMMSGIDGSVTINANQHGKSYNPGEGGYDLRRETIEGAKIWQ